MRIGVLTSSRADYYIYSPLLQKLEHDPFFDLNLLVFGSHLSKKHGYTVNDIVNDKYKITARINTTPSKDTPIAISESIGRTVISFSALWEKEKFDLVFALGDRYEMFAAVIASVPFNIPIAHIHGGESTIGAIDNVFRHSVSLISKLHFTSSMQYKKKLIQLIGNSANIYNVGSLGIENLKYLHFYSISEFNAKYHLDLSKPTILITFHPETINYKKNEEYINEIIFSLKKLKNYQFLITMPNADTFSKIIRTKWQEFGLLNNRSFLVENMGKIGYLSAMKYCSFMLGNSSSGMIEASYFPKPVINLGSRQSGRIVTPNLKTCDILHSEILKAVEWAETFSVKRTITLYGKGDASAKIIHHTKDFYYKLSKEYDQFS